ncbi:MAG: MmgE/PrpD family protein [Pseudomonadota bacterium]
MSEATMELARFAATLDVGAIPPEVAARAKLLVLDTIGIALRARHDCDSTPATLRAVAALGLAKGPCHVIGEEAGYSAAGAALINGALAHSLDFDDTHAPGSLHPSAPVVPAALAAVEIAGADGRALLAGIVAGYEVICRLARALGPADHYDRGFHPTATCGAFAAAAAAGRVLRLSHSQIQNAFGIALSQAAGSLQFLDNGAWTKRFQVGWAAMAGLVAAEFARQGYRGAARAFEGKHGFFRAYAPAPRPEAAVAGLGSTWETLAIAVKPYPSCRYTHAAIDAAIALRGEQSIDPARIASVEIGLSGKGLMLTAEPQEYKRRPRNVVDGQFSVHFCIAVALREGRLGWDDYATHLNDPKTRDLMGRFTAVLDQRAEAAYPRQMAGGVEIFMDDGTVHKRFVLTPKGEPNNFLTAAELRAKFSSLVNPYLGDAGEAQLFDAAIDLERAKVADIFRLARPPGRLAEAGED